MAAKPPKHHEICSVEMGGVRRRAVLAIELSEKCPARKVWDNLDHQVVKKLTNRIRTVLQAPSLSQLSDEMISHVREGVWYLRIRDPRWRAIFFVHDSDFYFVEFLFNPKNRDSDRAVDRAIGVKQNFVPIPKQKEQ